MKIYKEKPQGKKFKGGPFRADSAVKENVKYSILTVNIRLLCKCSGYSV
jgi:hypothetical protein